jgi:hypothetical protein
MSATDSSHAQVQKRKQEAFLRVLHIVSAHFPQEGNAAVGICRDAWTDTRIWMAIVEMLHVVLGNCKDFHFQASRLMLACHMGRLDVIKRLCAFGARIEARSGIGSTPLMFTAEKGQVQAARFLIDDMHADIDARDAHGSTPLMWACQEGQVEMIEFLCDRHVDIETLENDNESAL